MLVVLATMSEACSSTSSAAPSETIAPADAGGTATEPVRATASCMPDAPQFHAFLRTGSCADVEGKSGRWVARSLFPSAPSVIRDVACTYQWLATGGSAPDVDALAALGPDLLTRRAAIAPACDSPSKPASLAPLPQGSGDAPPTGVTGCDVCVRVFERQLFAILPAEEMSLRTLILGTSDGQRLVFDLTPPEDAPQVFSAELPPAPDNGAYLPRGSLNEAAF